MAFDKQQFEQRKQDHIDLALMDANQTTALNQLEHVTLHHEALPDLDFDDISLETARFGKAVRTPFMVASMTAGHDNALRINQHLMAACEQHGWAMGLGSQRRELTDPSAKKEWSHLRRDYPNVDLFSNLGVAQLISTPVEQVIALTETVQAVGLIIHCNPLQECIQPEGTPSFKGCWTALAELVEASPIPVVIKETGCGFSESTLMKLDEVGVAAVDVSGLGGTHWGRIEGHRASHIPVRQQAAATFKNWGVSTVDSVCMASALRTSYEIWGSGGVRHGLDAAKLLALGASTVAFAKPMLNPALQSKEEVCKCMDIIEYELKVAMFCTGSQHVDALRGKVCR